MRVSLALVIVLIVGCLSGDAFARRSSSHRKNGGGGSQRLYSVGGKVVGDEDGEWQVAVMINRRFACSGTLVRMDVVLTAAECVQGQEPAEMLVRAGTRNFKSGGQLRKIRETIHHPKYDEESHANNVALLQLMRPMNETLDSIATVNLPQSTDELPSHVIVYGWGILHNGENRTITKQLRSVRAKVLSARRCSRQLADAALVDTMFCTGDRTKRFDVCDFGLGSPAMSEDNVQYGIISESSACTGDSPSTVFTNILPLKSWIDETLDELRPPSKRQLRLRKTKA